MSVATFVPAIWAAALLAGLHKSLVFAQKSVVNMDYEGEIAKQGDQVKINFIGDITTFDVTRNEDIPDPEQLSTEQTTLLIDQAKGFNFQVDDADKVQVRGDLIETAMQEAAYGLRDKADTYIAGLYTGVDAANRVGTDVAPIVPIAETAYDQLVELAIKLDEQNVPTGGRWAIVPAWFYGLLRRDRRFVEAGTGRSDEVVKNGIIGQAAGFELFNSNNVRNTNGTLYKIMAGHPMAISYADQIAMVEAYRMEKRFADAVKGLHLYGAKLVRPKSLAVLTANRA